MPASCRLTGIRRIDRLCPRFACPAPFGAFFVNPFEEFDSGAFPWRGPRPTTTILTGRPSCCFRGPPGTTSSVVPGTGGDSFRRKIAHLTEDPVRTEAVLDAPWSGEFMKIVRERRLKNSPTAAAS